MGMKIIFAGTPLFAVEPLKQIVKAGYDVVAVVTQPDKPQGRKGIIAPSEVAKAAAELELPVYKFEKIRNHVQELEGIGADLMVTCAYGQILTQEVLDCFKGGVWNIHASLLPKYRGAAPIQWCVVNGEKYTGVTIMKTDVGLDTGDILLVKRIEIGEQETSGELSERLSRLGAQAIVEALRYIGEGSPQLMLQDPYLATTVKKISREQAKIDFNASAKQIVDKVRGMNPEPVAFALLDGKPLNIFRAEIAETKENAEAGVVVGDSPKEGLIVSCGGGAVRLVEVQMAGGKRMKGSDLLNGRKIKKGQRFGF